MAVDEREYGTATALKEVAEKAKALSPLQESLNHQAESSYGLLDLVERLENRLTPILSPSPQNTGDRTTQGAIGNSDIVAQVADTTSRIELVKDRLKHLLSTLEV